MEHVKRMARTHSFLLFFAFFGLVALAIYSLSSSDVVLNKPLVEKKVVDTQGVQGDVFDVTQYTSKIENALITVPDTSTKISLVDGRASYGTMLDGGDVTFVKLIGGIKVNSTTSHVFADVAVQSGGTGVFHYILLFEVTGDKVNHLSSYFIGDRVEVSSISLVSKDARSYNIKVDYLDRDIDQAMVEDPTVPKEVTIEVRNNEFVENSL